VSGHSLVNRIVEDFIDQMMETALVGAADVHSRADPNGFQPFKHLDIFRSVVGIGLLLHVHHP
jgi:hypothetical protein